MNPNRRLFWPYIIAALVVLFLHPRMLVDRVIEREQGSAGIAASFVLVLLVLASLRARLGSRLSDGVALLLCSVPFVLGLVAGSEPPPLDPEVFRLDPTQAISRQYELWPLVDLRSTGALGTLALLVAELVVWCRLDAVGGSARPITRGLLLALPFQLAWMVQSQSTEYFNAWRLSLLVPGLALVLIPLSLVRGGSRTARLLVGLGLALFLVGVLQGGEFMRLVLGIHGCGPATDLERLRFHQEELFGHPLFEAFPWAPALGALFASLLLVRKQRVVSALAVVALLVGLDAFAISRLSRLNDTLSDSRRGDEFIPRGRGVRYATALRLSEFVLLGADGAVLMRNPLADPEALGKLLGENAIVEDSRSCWHGPFSFYTRLPYLTLELDTRLSEAQELQIARIARRSGVVAIHFNEGEDRSEPDSPFVLSTHLARLVAGTSQATFFLGRDSVPPECKPDGLRTSTNIAGLRWHEEWVLELPLAENGE